MTNSCQFILNFLNCAYELFENEPSGEAIINRWNDLTEQGKQEGFFPLLIVPSEALVEALELSLEDAEVENTPDGIAASRAQILRQAETINPQEFLQQRLTRLWQNYSEADLRGDFREAEPDDCFYSHHLTVSQPHPELIIAKIPAQHPWELAAWLPMGDFNSCPAPAKQVAVFKYWHEKYGAVPGVVTYENWELELTRPPLTDADAEALAEEFFAFCEESVVQASEGWGSIRALASALKGSTTWYFWWD
jgi:hypothetical protein